MRGRADMLLPLTTPAGEADVYPGAELTDDLRAAVDIEERFAPGSPGDPDVRVLVYRPKGQPEALPLIVSIHGGGFVRMRADSFPAMDARLALLGAIVVSVDYRLAPEHPFPAAPEDCYAALCWAVTELPVDTSRVVVTGGSAGGALAAALTLMTRDRGGPAISFQALMIPVLDDRLTTPSMQQYATSIGFSGANAEGMWLHYLGEDTDRSATSPYAAPARATDLTGLPAAYIQVNGLDPLRDEGNAYAQRLLAAGVTVELYCAPGLYHGAEPLDPAVALQARALMDAAIARAIR